MKKFTKDTVKESFGIWKSMKSSVGFVRSIRDESEKRLKKLSL